MSRVFVAVCVAVAVVRAAPPPPHCNPETHMPAEYAIKEGAVPLIFLPQDKVNERIHRHRTGSSSHQWRTHHCDEKSGLGMEE